jgi:hypothetical protein
MQAPLLALLLALHLGSPAAEKCTALLDGSVPVETLCYSVIESHGALQLRHYNVSSATAVTYDVAAGVTIYQEAQTEAAFYVLGYFTGECNAANKSLAPAARTVPLVLRTNTGESPGWVGSMIVAPSLYPTPLRLPVPKYGVKLEPVAGSGPGALRLASLRTQFQQSPQPSDFEAVCAQLTARLAKLGIKVDAASGLTPSHAYYFSREWTGPWDFECWVAVL